MRRYGSPHRRRPLRRVWPGAVLAMCVLIMSGQSGEHEPRAIEPRAIDEGLQRDWRIEDDALLDTLDDDLARRVRWIQEELWKRGHAARIARGTRTLDAQRKGFLLGHSKTLRSKHLCGKAVDFKLHPHDYPEVDHPFWDIKDELARQQKLLVLNAPSFRDRPHVELDEDCDWDSVGLGPEGTWSTHEPTSERGQRLDVRLNRETGRHEGTLRRHGRLHTIERVEVRHVHSGERNCHEEAFIEVTFTSQADDSFTQTYKVSHITSKGHGYVRADWRFLVSSDPKVRLDRVEE